MPRTVPRELGELLLTHDFDITHPCLRWMVLTWDQAFIDAAGANMVFRTFLTYQGLLLVRSRRTRSKFTTTIPVLGGISVAPHQVKKDWLARAAEATNDGIRQGHHLVCRPLAVDCSAFAGRRTYEGEAIESPAQLLQELVEMMQIGGELLSHINTVRAGALITHLDPDWAEHFPRHTAEDLWAGA